MSTPRDLDRLVQEMKGRTPLRASALLFTIFAVIGAVFLWAWLTEIDDVTRAPGRIVPAGDVQRVQAAEAGVIRAVFVEEGAIVEAGAPLVELDGLAQTSQLDREVQRAIALQTRIERLSAEIEGRAPVFAAALEAAAPELVVSERALHAGRAAALASEISVLDRRREQRRQEQLEARTEIRTATRTRDILAEERAIIAPLVERGVEPQTTLLTLRRQEEEIGGRIAGAEAALARLETALAEVEDTIAATRSQFAAEALRELADATGELAALRPSLPALESMAARAVLRAPVAGIVNRLHRRTIGGAVRAGEEVAEIVPLNDTLLVEAYVLPQDIAFLRPDQPVRVKLTAYDFTRYGALEGRILRIGADAVRRSERDEAEVFVIVVRTEGALYDADGAAVRIIPGMIAEIDILAKRRRVIDYLLQPLERVRARAFQE
ncbi:HlyD family type I secretion periplasmic adaptor subunit [Paracoccaceae bacterium Fryx2]|nr:HlyD family type I secretion periplasmic adaptor subunit [Paracoccaceae bacterium Fryx2]